MRGKGRVCRGLLGGSLFIFVCELFITVTEACQGWDKGSAPSRGCDSGRTRRTLTAAAPEILLIDADLICHDCSVLAPLDCGLWSSVQRGSYFSWSDRSLCVFYPSPSPPPPPTTPTPFLPLLLSVQQLHLFPKSWYARLLIMRVVSDLDGKRQTGSGRNSRSFDGMACEMARRWYLVPCVPTMPRNFSGLKQYHSFKNMGKFVITCAHA